VGRDGAVVSDFCSIQVWTLRGLTAPSLRAATTHFLIDALFSSDGFAILQRLFILKVLLTKRKV
jgi:hypothetical protein